MIRSLLQFNETVGLVLTILYIYQVFYTLLGLAARLRSRLSGARQNPDTPLRRYAAVICARNEENVIADLIGSLRAQRYPRELLDIYVVADNCTDRTADIAREAGATVYERADSARVGKGYALDFLFKRIREDGAAYDAFLVFDADNLVDPMFVRAMNETYAKGYDVITSYRNSKNFGANWIAAGYSIWFLREACFLNHPRMLLHTNCAISGTGFLVSSRVIEQNGGWPYFLLTEDIEFSAACAANGLRIGYCDGAMVYDEQPTSFRQSWRQRMRWAKGFYQVNLRYGPRLLRGCFTGKLRFSCFDMLMTIAPCMLLTVLVCLVNAILAVSFLTKPRYLAMLMLRVTGRSIGRIIGGAYVAMALYALLTVVVEWRRIAARPFKRVQYIVLFPLFMMTYVPISLAALFARAQWKPIRHGEAGGVKV